MPLTIPETLAKHYANINLVLWGHIFNFYNFPKDYIIFLCINPDLSFFTDG